MLYTDLAALAEQHGHPFYLYEEEKIAAQLALLQRTFQEFTILYSIKTNPHPEICRFMACSGVGADAASSYEVGRALDAGIKPEDIFYSAPGKTVKEIADGLGKCVITADSYNELLRLETMAKESGLFTPDEPMPVGLRINPDMSFQAGEFPEITKGVSSKFGVDEESLTAHKELFASLRYVRLRGIHVFLRSQVLNHASLATYFEKAFALGVRCKEEFGGDISFINFGGGLGIAPTADSPGLDIHALRESIRELVAAYSPLLPGCRLYLESGRFLVGAAGTFVTRIEDVKTSRGKTYVIAPGCLNGFLRPSVMNLLGGLPVPVKGPYEPLYSNSSAHRIALPGKQGEARPVTVCGNLCTSLDAVATDVPLPDPQVGDLLTISNAGAYAATLSPSGFGSFPAPVEIYMGKDGTFRHVP